MTVPSPVLLRETEFAALARSGEPLDRFGPATERPLIAVQIEEGAAALADFARSLPCPVIAIGGAKTMLGQACDLAIEAPDRLDLLHRRVIAAPLAAMVLVQHLRVSSRLPIAEALLAESLAFATVQQGPDFRNWQRRTPQNVSAAEPDRPLAVTRRDGLLRLTMNDAARLNAIGVDMRDALGEALDLALADPAIERVELEAVGRCFSAGGDVGEFGRCPIPQQPTGSAHCGFRRTGPPG